MRAAMAPVEGPWQPKDALSTGSTLLNLALTGKPRCGLLKGRFYDFVGDSTSGKTWFAKSVLAEASINSHFNEYAFVLDDAEGGSLMDDTKFFGPAAAARTKPPGGYRPDGKPVNSTTTEEFYFHMDNWLKRAKPFIYALDSMDGLTNKDEQDKFQAEKKAWEKGKEATGTFGVAQAKKNSRNLRTLMTPLRNTESILISIGQTRDNINPLTSRFKPKTRAGGNAIFFFATCQIWTSVAKHLKKTVRGNPVEIGVVSRIHCTKNRLTGRDCTVEVPILRSVGIDDIGSCVDYLCKWKHWKFEATKDDDKITSITAPEFDHKGTREALIKKIEDDDSHLDLQMLTAEVWDEVEEEAAVERKPRYGQT